MQTKNQLTLQRRLELRARSMGARFFGVADLTVAQGGVHNSLPPALVEFHKAQDIFCHKTTYRA